LQRNQLRARAEREVADAVTARRRKHKSPSMPRVKHAQHPRARTTRIGRVREIAQRKLAAQIAALEHDESTLSVDDAAVTTAGDAAIARPDRASRRQDSA
jgi:hypothetical protein